MVEEQKFKDYFEPEEIIDTFEDYVFARKDRWYIGYAVNSWQAHEVEWEAQQHWTLLKHHHGESQDLRNFKCPGCNHTGVPARHKYYPYRCIVCGYCFACM
jgi:hypothetical protein